VPIETSPPDIESLYSNHHGWLLSWLRRRLGDSFDAADLAHDAFVRLIQRPRRFDSTSEARAYLRAMANGMCVDIWRRRQIERVWLEELASRPEAAAPSVEHQAIVVQALLEVDAMLRGMPVKAANAFVMAVACDMTDKEVAAELGVSTRMVRKYVAQAMFHCLLLEARGVAADLPRHMPHIVPAASSPG